jgi:thiol-disulfide isomerase/thioredoxin
MSTSIAQKLNWSALRKGLPFLAAIAAIGLGFLANSVVKKLDHFDEAPLVPTDLVLAPELAGIEGWLNSPPLNLESLRGHVVLIDFWTFDCINCLRTLPSIHKWHETYAADGLIVLGIHSPEFPFERDPNQVAAAVKRLAISYPVALDGNHATWKQFGVSAWPTIILINRSGQIVLRHAGEGRYDEIEAALRTQLH